MDESDYATPEQLADSMADLAHEACERGASPVYISVLASNGSTATYLDDGDLESRGLERIVLHPVGDGFCWPLGYTLINADGCVQFGLMHPRDGIEKATLVYAKAISETGGAP